MYLNIYVDGVLTNIKHYRDITECNSVCKGDPCFPKSVCKGDRSKKCGGGFKNNIYKRKKGKCEKRPKRKMSLREGVNKKKVDMV